MVELSLIWEIAKIALPNTQNHKSQTITKNKHPSRFRRTKVLYIKLRNNTQEHTRLLLKGLKSITTPSQNNSPPSILPQSLIVFFSFRLSLLNRRIKQIKANRYINPHNRRRPNNVRLLVR